MKKILLVGRSECGKTTLTQALRGETIHYHKTQYVNHFDVIIDTPGEYAENKFLGRALALYSYEADVVGLLLSATEPYSSCPAQQYMLSRMESSCFCPHALRQRGRNVASTLRLSQ